MSKYPEPAIKLIDQLSRLPGIGRKTAQRLAFYILKSDDTYIRNLSDAINDIKKNILFCDNCGIMSEEDHVIGSTAIEDIGEINTGDPDELVEFVQWAQTNYPAEHYALNIWNHGSGATGVAYEQSCPDYCWDYGNEAEEEDEEEEEAEKEEEEEEGQEEEEEE